MTALVFTSIAQAQALQQQVDAALGMPIAGRDIGGGVHAPPAMSVTATYAVPQKHPTLTKWAYPVDAVTAPILGPSTTSAAMALDPSWTPTPTVPTGTVQTMGV